MNNIECVLSNDCEYCSKQLEEIKRFNNSQVRIIKLNSQEFNDYQDKDLVEAVPFVLIRKDNGDIKYAGKGLHDYEKLCELIGNSDEVPAFNLKKIFAAKNKK